MAVFQAEPIEQNDPKEVGGFRSKLDSTCTQSKQMSFLAVSGRASQAERRFESGHPLSGSG
jgi:hypothetical protein